MNERIRSNHPSTRSRHSGTVKYRETVTIDGGHNGGRNPKGIDALPPGELFFALSRSLRAEFRAAISPRENPVAKYF